MNGKANENVLFTAGPLRKRTRSFVNPRQVRNESNRKIASQRVLKEVCKILCDTGSDCSSDGNNSSDWEDEVDCFISSEEDNVSDDGTMSHFVDMLVRVKMKSFRRMTFPYPAFVEEEIQQIYAQCTCTTQWIKDTIEVRSSVSLQAWCINSFRENMPIMVNSSGDSSIKITRWQNLNEGVVAFGIQKHGRSEILYVSAAARSEPGILQLRSGSSPTYHNGSLESDYRFFRQIYLEEGGKTILKPVSSSSLYLAITNGMLSLVSMHSDKDALQWDIEYI